MAEEGDGDPLALTGLQHAVQRQDVKDLKEGEIKIWKARMDAEEPLQKTPNQCPLD